MNCEPASGRERTRGESTYPVGDRKVTRPRPSNRRMANRWFPRRRPGIAIAWLVIWGVVFLTMLCFAVEIGTIYLAQSELETAMEAAALAGVREWNDSGDASSARSFAVSYAAFNNVNDQGVPLDRNDGLPPADPNGNHACNGDLVLGVVSGPDCNNYDFDPSQAPAGSNHGVHAEKRLQINSVCGQLFHLPLGPYSIHAHATAALEAGGAPRLVRIRQFLNCP